MTTDAPALGFCELGVESVRKCLLTPQRYSSARRDFPKLSFHKLARYTQHGF